MKKAVYPGSFDPITYGHKDIAERALKVFDELIILVSTNPNKSHLFSAEERMAFVKKMLNGSTDRIKICTNKDLTVKKAMNLGATHIVRGLRAVTDFEYEFQMTHANRALEQRIDSVFFMTDNKYSFLSSNTVKEIAEFKGDLTSFVPNFIADELYKKFHE